jgi:hypothetical protein
VRNQWTEIRRLRRSSLKERGDGGITARVFGVRTVNGRRRKFAVGRNPLLAAKRFKTLVQEAGNRWPEG